MQFSLLDLQQVVYQATGAQHCYHSSWHDFLRFGESDAHDDSKNCLEQVQTNPTTEARFHSKQRVL